MKSCISERHCFNQLHGPKCHGVVELLFTQSNHVGNSNDSSRLGVVVAHHHTHDRIIRATEVVVVGLVLVFPHGRHPHRPTGIVLQLRIVLGRAVQYCGPIVFVHVFPRDVLRHPVNPKQLQLQLQVVHQPIGRLRHIKQVGAQEHQQEGPVLHEARRHQSSQFVCLLLVPIHLADVFLEVIHGTGDHLGRFFDGVCVVDAVDFFVDILPFLDGQCIQALDDGALPFRW
mmetsp:Transcript_19683/g.55614  ORF Transcript_19683/g.55614 Transcript_19683/m.55614 type:complete len:229 (+) Transcript_19683:751-1437(+)